MIFRPFLFIALLVTFSVSFAQQDANYSQYMNNSLAINSGYAATRDLICVSAVHRQDKVGLKGTSATSVFSINSPVKLLKGGVGLNITNDQIGFNKDLGLNAIYAYTHNFSDGQSKLGIGLNLGFMNNSLDATWETMDGTSTTDPFIPQPKGTAMTFDLGFGAYYRSDLLYLGISTTHLTAPKIKYSVKANPKMSRHFYLTGGYSLALSNPQFEFQPSVFVATTGLSSSFDLNGMLLYNKRIWAGLSYRVSSAIVGMAGLELKNGIRIGYSYDFATSALQKFSSGSHEITLGYSFSIEKEKIPHKYKSVRFL